MDFSDIKDPIPEYAEQKLIDTNRVNKLLVALVHFKFDVPTLIRYLGGNYTGKFQDV